MLNTNNKKLLSYILTINTYCGVADFIGVSSLRYIFDFDLPT